jgi:glutathione S-transferase
MLTLYQFEISPFCDKIRRILHVKKQPYTVVEIPLTGTLTRLKKINPTGKVPAIDHDGHVVGDSTDIARYLESRFPTPPLVPADARLRAQCHVLEDWADESLYFYELSLRFTLPHNAKKWVPIIAASDAAVVQRVAGLIVPPTIKRRLVAQGLGHKTNAQILDEVGRHIDAVGGLLGGGDWLVGDALSIADIAVFAQLFCIGGTPEGAARIADVPAVGKWMTRVDEATRENATA